MIEVTDDLIEKSNALDAVTTDCVLTAEVPELGNRRKHDYDRIIGLVVEILADETRQNKIT